MSDNTIEEKPVAKLVQRYAYFTVENGMRVVKHRYIDIALGYSATTKDGKPYISFIKKLGDVVTDVNGVVNLSQFAYEQRESL